MAAIRFDANDCSRNGALLSPLLNSCYDAQIWATERFNQVPIIYNEDFKVGATLPGLTVCQTVCS
jgi:hypothetical protein